MTGFVMKEKFGDLDISYEIKKNGQHSGAISGYINGDPIIEDLNFTTAFELCTALQKAQMAILTRANTAAVIHSSLDDVRSQHFIKYAVEHLRKLAGQGTQHG